MKPLQITYVKCWNLHVWTRSSPCTIMSKVKLSPCDKISSMKLPEAFTYNLQSLEGSVMGGGIYDTPLRAQEMVPVRGQWRCRVDLHLLTTCYSDFWSLPADATVLQTFHRTSTQTLIVCFCYIHHVVMMYIIPGILYEWALNSQPLWRIIEAPCAASLRSS